MDTAEACQGFLAEPEQRQKEKKDLDASSNSIMDIFLKIHKSVDFFQSNKYHGEYKEMYVLLMIIMVLQIFGIQETFLPYN